MPTSDSSDEEVETVYGIVDEYLQNTSTKESVFIIGDFNAKVGQTDEAHLKNMVGAFRLGVQNERGKRLVQFAIDNNLAITNTMFKHNYILIRERWRTSVKNVKAKRKAECDSDHKLLQRSFG
ncbi:craniofacial development protein 2-like [Temnothorax longispinosus]|uniref:craniofacial development protein 2-like n=1 Tax=Temnothorax longispinosus TaxID=300112 RepID=UPI003A9A227B